MLDLSLTRYDYKPDYTAGILQIGSSKWVTLEDAVRKTKIMHRTAIPAGRYEIVPHVFASRYQIRPLLKDVPNFYGVFMHVGNRPEDTSGCLLIGKAQSFGTIINSSVAYAEVCAHLCTAWTNKQDVFIQINDQPDHPWFDENVA